MNADESKIARYLQAEVSEIPERVSLTSVNPISSASFRNGGLLIRDRRAAWEALQLAIIARENADKVGLLLTERIPTWPAKCRGLLCRERS